MMQWRKQRSYLKSASAKPSEGLYNTHDEMRKKTLFTILWVLDFFKKTFLLGRIKSVYVGIAAHPDAEKDLLQLLQFTA